MTCPEMNLVGLHTDLQMLFHPYPLFLYKLCHSFNKRGGGARIPHMCGICGVTRWQRHGYQLGVTWHARGTPVDSWCYRLRGGGLCFLNVVGRRGSPVASAMVGNGVLLGMLRTCLSTVVVVD